MALVEKTGQMPSSLKNVIPRSMNRCYNKMQAPGNFLLSSAPSSLWSVGVRWNTLTIVNLRNPRHQLLTCIKCTQKWLLTLLCLLLLIIRKNVIKGPPLSDILKSTDEHNARGKQQKIKSLLFLLLLSSHGTDESFQLLTFR